MKKTTLFTMLLILVLAFPVAAEVTITGEIQPGFISNFSDYALPFFASASEFAFNAKADDFTTVNLTLTVADKYITAAELGGDSTMVGDLSLPAAPVAPGYTDIPGVRFLYFTTDVGGATGLKDMGVDVEVMGGYFRPQNNRYAISNYAPEMVVSFRNPATAIDLTVGVMDKMLNFEVAFDEQVFYAKDSYFNIAGKPGPQLWAGVFGGVAPIWAEFYYYSNYNPDFKGQIGVAAKFMMDIMPDVFALSATAQFKYDLQQAEDNVDGLMYAIGVGVRADVMKMAYLSVSYVGNDFDIFNLLYFEAGANYMNMVGVDAGLSTSFAQDADALQAIEFSGWAMLGTANKFRIGYLVLDENLVVPSNAGSAGQVPHRVYSPIAPQKGGLFVRWDVKF